MVFTGLYFLPERQKKKPREFFTQLFTPEQAKIPEIVSPPVRPAPAEPRIRPAPTVPRTRNQLAPAAKIPHPEPLTPERPVVPGQGNDYGQPLPEGRAPRPGRSDSDGSEDEDGISSGPGYQDTGRLPARQEAPTRGKLFDRAIIGSTALKGEGSKKKSDVFTFDTQDYRYAGYMRKLKEKIESIWEYPPEARRKGLYGDLKITFTIKKDGSLGAVDLVRTSGYKLLDDAALKALKDGEPYWPIPDEWGMEAYTIKGHFFYTMYGYGIR